MSQKRADKREATRKQRKREKAQADLIRLRSEDPQSFANILYGIAQSNEHLWPLVRTVTENKELTQEEVAAILTQITDAARTV